MNSSIKLIHDIRNKLTILNMYTGLLSKKNESIDFKPIIVNVDKINELLVELHSDILCNSINNTSLEMISTKDLVKKFEENLKNLSQMFPLRVSFQCHRDFRNDEENVFVDMKLFNKTIDNAFGNSLNAKSSDIHIFLIKSKTHLIFELIDNGIGLKSNKLESDQASSNIPHGLGTKIMSENMQKMFGLIEWLPREFDHGAIVRLHLKIKFDQ